MMAYGFFPALDDLIVTGPTRTNVNDFRAILVARCARNEPGATPRMRRQRKAKIVATLGPRQLDAASRSRALFQAGADVFRLNFSHGTHEDHRRATRRSARSRTRSAGRSAS